MVLRSLPFQEAYFLAYVPFHGIDYDVSIDTIVSLAKQKQNGV